MLKLGFNQTPVTDLSDEMKSPFEKILPNHNLMYYVIVQFATIIGK